MAAVVAAVKGSAVGGEEEVWVESDMDSSVFVSFLSESESGRSWSLLLVSQLTKPPLTTWKNVQKDCLYKIK